jgi:GNAT superfamily N-acetyltransferase
VSKDTITYRQTQDLPPDQVLALYRANGWSAAEKPEALCAALKNSHALISAWHGDCLVGLGNALSDGHLVVYYPHLLVLPQYQGQGIGRRIMALMQEKYGHFHQQVLIADGRAVEFYQKCGFTLAGKTRSMWIYQGKDHS